MAKAELGTKRTCPETGKNFYDLNKDPVVSPYTGKTYPLSFFETAPKPTKESRKAAKPEPEAEAEEDEDEDIEDVAEVEEDDEIEETEVAKELGDDEDEVVLEGAADADDEETAVPGKVPAGFQAEGVDDDDDDVILDDDADTFEIDDDDDLDLDDALSGDEDADTP